MVSAVTQFAAFSDKVNHYTRSVMKSGNPRHPSSLPILLALLLVLPGCAWLPGGKKADDKAATQAIADGAAALTEAPANPSFDIRVEVDDDELKALVERHNDLQRYRAVREACLVDSLDPQLNPELGELARLLRTMSGLYDQAARAATSL